MATTQSTDENVRLARRVPEEIATEHDLDLVDELATEDTVDHFPWGDVRGPEALKAELGEFVEAFPDFSATVEEAIAEDDLVAMRVTLRGTHEGTFRGIEPTGNKFEVQNQVFTRVEDGKIAERWLVPDMLGLLTQLGVVDAPEM